MTHYHEKDVQAGFAVFRHLLVHGALGPQDDHDLYRVYRDHTAVEDLVNDVFLPGVDASVVRGKKAYYLTPGLDNAFLAMKNADLRREMGLANNRELHLAFFIMLCLLSRLYTDEGSENSATYVSIRRLEGYVTAKLKGVAEPANGDEAERILRIEEECEYRLGDIAAEWEDKPPYDETLQHPASSKRNRYSFIVKVGRFMMNHGLCHVVEDRDLYPTDRLDAIVTQYYPQPKNKERLLSLLHDLGEG